MYVCMYIIFQINNIILIIYILDMKFTIIILLCIVQILVLSYHPESKLSFQDYCKFYNYPVESHVIKTEDGYLLTFFRIQKKGSTFRDGLKPILLQHGLLDSSDTWIINDESKAPAFILANQNFDVWLGNSRGNKYSRKHIKLNPDKDKQFWEFSFQNMSKYDLTAAFKYITLMTNSKLNYIGHSQGTIIMHIALAQNNPTIQTLLDKYFAFGPVVFVQYQTSKIFELLNRSNLFQFYRKLGIHQFLPSMNWLQTDIGVLFCSQFPKICADFFVQIMDADPNVDNYERYDVLAGHSPAGTSLMNMLHWQQLQRSNGKFQAFDYGNKIENQAHYGQDFPIIWNLKNIRKPIRLFVGNSDQLADIIDVDAFWNQLPRNVKQFYRIYNAGHCTFLWGKDVNPWMNDVLSYF